MRKVWVVILAIAAASVSACAIKDFPREVTAKEKMETNYAYDFDTIGAMLAAAALTGPRYDVERQKVHIDYQYYLDPRFRSDPASFYPAPEGMPAVEFGETLADDDEITAVLIKWPSQYRPMNPAFAGAYASYPETHTAYGVYVRSKTLKNRGAFVNSHGWTGGDVRKGWKGEPLREYAALGYDSVLVQQPYHGLRMPAEAKFSGEYFFSGEVARTNEAFCQTVTDARSMVSWLRGEGYEVVGLRGGSLGGITTLLVAGVEDRVDFAVAWVPPSSLSDIPEDTPLAPYIIEGLHASGLPLEDVRDIYFVSSPDNFRPAIAEDRIFVFAGMGDNFVPPALPAKIEAAWPGINIFWFAGGHVLNFERKECDAIEQRFLLDRLGD